MSFNRFFTQAMIPFLCLTIATPVYADGECDAMCGLTKENAKSLIQDETCKNDPSCVDCVVNAMTSSQVGAYCSAYTKSHKAKTGEVVNAALNTAATITCGTACALALNPYTAAGQEAWNRVCGFSGLAVTATEIGYTIANLVNNKDADLIGLASQALTVKNALNATKSTTKIAQAEVARQSAFALKAGASQSAVEATAKEALKTAKTEAARSAGKAACWNVVQYGIAAAAKIASISQMKKTANSSCDSAQSLANASAGAVQSCRAYKQAGTSTGGGTIGLFAATAQSFTAPAIDDVERMESKTDADKYLKEMKGDLAFAEKAGKFDLADIAKKIENGEEVSSIMAGAGLPQESIDLVKGAEERIKRGESSKLLAAITGGGYVASGSSGEAGSGGSTFSNELAFGDPGATPGEGAETLEIDRKVAGSAIPGLGMDGDVFHSAFSGTIFDIVSHRIQGSKENYAELEPAARLNRVFNGYSDPKRGKK